MPPSRRSRQKRVRNPPGVRADIAWGGVESAMAPLARAPNHYDISWVCLLLVVVFV